MSITPLSKLKGVIMEKIYGFKKQDVIKLCELINKNPNLTPTRIFKEYSMQSGKSKGTVRNMYYALAKLTKENEQFRDTYLNGKELNVGKIEGFSNGEDLELVKRVLKLKNEGLSIRKAVNKLADGDAKLALRYMNKYRSTLKNKPQIIDLAIKELGIKKERIAPEIRNSEMMVIEVQIAKVKKEINNLVLRISENLRKENEYLKGRVCLLELQNLKLNNLLYGEKSNSALKYFTKSSEQTPFLN